MQITLRLILFALLEPAIACAQSRKILYPLLARTMYGRMVGHVILNTDAGQFDLQTKL